MAATRSRHQSLWAPAPSTLTFPTCRVDVWKVYLDQSTTEDSTDESDAGVLSSDEIARARRFHFEKDRIHFTRCRSTLRNLLARYLALSAGEILFEYAANGKPQVSADQNPRLLHFNVSHSAAVALIAVGSEHRLGVDIEKIRSDVDTAALAERFFSDRERAGLRALPDHLRMAAFYACWTRKEAFLKATGDGFSFPLADFSVTTHPDLDPELEEIRGDTEARRCWGLADVSIEAGFRAAVAVESALAHLETYSLT